MGRKLNQGFTLIEVIIMATLVMTTLGFGLFGIGSINKMNDRYHIHYNQVVTEYNILQIIKSDHRFYEHPEDYFGHREWMTFATSGTQQHLTIYFDRYNEVCDQGIYESYIKIICTPTTSTNNTRYYYTIQKYQKSNQNLDTKQGGLISFTVYDA